MEKECFLNKILQNTCLKIVDRIRNSKMLMHMAHAVNLGFNELMFKMCFCTEIFKNTHKVLSKYKKNYFAIWKNKVF